MKQADIGDIRSPDVIWPANLQMIKKIRINPIVRLGPARPAFRIDRCHSHHPHQPFDSLVIDAISLPFQDFRHPRRSIKRRLQVLLVDHPHQFQVELGFSDAFVVIRRPGHVQQITLPAKRDLRGGFDQDTLRPTWSC